MKLSPYDLWKEKADRSNEYRLAYVYRRNTLIAFSLAFAASLVLNVYLAYIVC